MTQMNAGPQAPGPQPPFGIQTSEQAFAGLSSEEKNWGMFCHLAALVGFVGIPFGSIIGPLVVWLIKKDTMPFVNVNGKEALNFQISLAIYALCCIPLMFILVGFILLFAVLALDLVMIIIAAMKANKGIAFKYPLCIRLVK